MMSGGNGSIPKGFILKARKIEDSEVAHASPCTREMWDLILRKANFRNRKCGNTTIKRGQWFTTYEEIQELLHWCVGYRKLTYTRHQINAATKYLRSRLMVTTTKATRGFFITVVNYERYQQRDNYERHNGRHNEDHDNATGQRKNGKKEEQPLYPLPGKPPKAGAAKPGDPGLVLDCWNAYAGRSVEKDGNRIAWKSHKRKPDGLLPPDIETAIRRCLEAGYSIEEMCGGINNYATVLLGSEYWWSHVWPLVTFLTVADGRGKDALPKWTKFHPDNFVPETYTAKRRNSNQDESEQDIGRLAGCGPTDEEDAARVYQEAGLIEE